MSWVVLILRSIAIKIKMQVVERWTMVKFLVDGNGDGSSSINW